MVRFLLSAILILAITIPAHSSLPPERRVELTDSLYKVLPTVKSNGTRLKILYDIFDLAPADSVTQTGERVLEAALESSNHSAAMDMFRRLTSFNSSRDTARVSGYLKSIEKLPDSPEKSATICFMYICATSGKARYATEAERHRNIYELMKRYKSTSDHDSTIYERIVLLSALCIYMDATMPNEMLADYLTQLDQLIHRMPFRLTGLENKFYIDAAMSYTFNEQPSRAVAADRQLLDVIDRLDLDNMEQGRLYRNYDKHRYTVYRRMLSNFSALSDDEVDDIHNKITEISKRDQEVAYDIINRPSAEGYYLLAKHRYSEAIPLLVRSLESERQNGTRRRLLRLIVQAASAINDNKTLARYGIMYTKALEETLRERTLARGKELSALLGLPKTISGADLEIDENDSETTVSDSTLYMSFAVISIILAGTVIFFITLYRRANKLSKKAQQANDMLSAERDNLRRIQASLIETRDEARKANRHKSDFISNMTHEVTTPLNAIVECAHLIVDNVSSEKRQYLDRFARTIEVSADLLRTLINDVLEVNNLESGTLIVQRATVPLNTICMAALESARLYTKPGVDLRWANENEPTHVIYTDARRVEQVLVNLLTNGLKFTDKGFVELACHVDVENGTTTFTVTDSGIGVPIGKEHLIFERFEKLSPMTQGNGLGLSICKMIAVQLKGEIYVDTTYEGEGSRFVFTIPSLP
ncbi:MAG: HAMP domain-containing histidine kinase [Paramuribaculum sp.]|nr:HAMP domain-containing histidine kinase [Paramuribaculum sp.]